MVVWHLDRVRYHKMSVPMSVPDVQKRWYRDRNHQNGYRNRWWWQPTQSDIMFHTRFGSKIIDSGGGSKIMVWGQKSSIPGPSKKGSKNDDFHGGGQKMVNPMGGSQKNGQKRGQKSILSLLCKGPAAGHSVDTTWPDWGFSISWVMVSKNVKSVQGLVTFYYGFSWKKRTKHSTKIVWWEWEKSAGNR